MKRVQRAVIPAEQTASQSRIAPLAFFRALVPSFVAIAILLSGCTHHAYSPPPPAPPPSATQPGATRPSPSRPSGAPPRGQPAVPGEYVEEGVASWYGDPFNGHRTSNGEIYDMYQFTAAHRTLPFGAVLRVTNLSNGKQTEVRINDRGPFVGNRIIDLSLSAARAIDMVGPGTAQVRIEMLGGPSPTVGAFGVQVGAFLVKENADALRDRLAAQFSPVIVVPYDSPNGQYFRVRVGRVASEGAAGDLANQLRAAGQNYTFVVRLDD
ncbi:MAG TPA: septal ring lytic transglycosylase RlpA family protein [Candidatus Acidoferrales bacterium]|nr:septal ring lytic transglycosylase RlpA family protein [Candidatus Acidoferrales bacterium]